jgi:hypothetical protein
MVLFKINCWIKCKRNHQLTSVFGEFVGKPLIFSVEIAKVILSLDLPPSKLDIGTNYEFWKKI